MAEKTALQPVFHDEHKPSQWDSQGRPWPTGWYIKSKGGWLPDPPLKSEKQAIEAIAEMEEDDRQMDQEIKEWLDGVSHLANPE